MVICGLLCWLDSCRGQGCGHAAVGLSKPFPCPNRTREEWSCLPKRVGLSSDMIPEVLDCSKGQSLPDGFLRFFL